MEKPNSHTPPNITFLSDEEIKIETLYFQVITLTKTEQETFLIDFLKDLSFEVLMSLSDYIINHPHEPHEKLIYLMRGEIRIRLINFATKAKEVIREEIKRNIQPPDYPRIVKNKIDNFLK